jgi:type IV pilus assembly protein PilO
MPSEAEVAALLRKVSKKAKESGLEIRLFETEEPERKDFYYELPNKIEVLGNYDDLGLFVSSLSTLDRIVTVHDVMIANPEKEKNKEDTRLEMKAIVRTYNEASEDDDDLEEAAGD